MWLRQVRFERAHIERKAQTNPDFPLSETTATPYATLYPTRTVSELQPHNPVLPIHQARPHSALEYKVPIRTEAITFIEHFQEDSIEPPVEVKEPEAKPAAQINPVYFLIASLPFVLVASVSDCAEMATGIKDMAKGINNGTAHHKLLGINALEINENNSLVYMVALCIPLATQLLTTYLPYMQEGLKVLLDLIKNRKLPETELSTCWDITACSLSIPISLLSSSIDGLSSYYFLTKGLEDKFEVPEGLAIFCGSVYFCMSLSTEGVNCVIEMRKLFAGEHYEYANCLSRYVTPFVSTILATANTMGDIIEGYTVLRIIPLNKYGLFGAACVLGVTDFFFSGKMLREAIDKFIDESAKGCINIKDGAVQLVNLTTALVVCDPVREFMLESLQDAMDDLFDIPKDNALANLFYNIICFKIMIAGVTNATYMAVPLFDKLSNKLGNLISNISAGIGSTLRSCVPSCCKRKPAVETAPDKVIFNTNLTTFDARKPLLQQNRSQSSYYAATSAQPKESRSFSWMPGFGQR